MSSLDSISPGLRLLAICYCIIHRGARACWLDLCGSPRDMGPKDSQPFQQRQVLQKTNLASPRAFSMNGREVAPGAV